MPRRHCSAYATLLNVWKIRWKLAKRVAESRTRFSFLWQQFLQFVFGRYKESCIGQCCRCDPSCMRNCTVQDKSFFPGGVWLGTKRFCIFFKNMATIIRHNYSRWRHPRNLKTKICDSNKCLIWKKFQQILWKKALESPVQTWNNL